MNFPNSETDRLLLRKVMQDDKAVIFKGLSDPEITQYLTIHFNTLDETQTQLEFYENHWKNQTGIFWGIESKEQKQLTGVIGIYDINSKHLRAELGYWLLKEYWGSGIITEAALHVLKYAFGQLDLNRIYAYVDKQNVASKVLLKKLGFIHEGTMRQFEISRKGQYINLMIYARLRSD